MDKEIDESNPVIAQILRGERPENMTYAEFRIKRKMIDNYLKRRKKGKFVYVSKELSDITDENGKKKQVIKSYGPYRKDK